MWVNALSSTSDTNVANKRVDGKILLQDDDLIEIGQRKFIFHALAGSDKIPGSAKVSFSFSLSLSLLLMRFICTEVPMYLLDIYHIRLDLQHTYFTSHTFWGDSERRWWV